MEQKDVSVFRYRTSVGVNIEEIFRTTYFDGMEFYKEGDLTLDDAGQYVVNLFEDNRWFREMIAKELRNMADKIVSGEQKLNGYICDYNSYSVETNCHIIDIDWKKINEEKLNKPNS